MNRKIFVLAALTSVFAMSANAFDGTINFTGELTDQTCVAKVNGISNTASVVLPKLSTKMLSAAGIVAGATNFTIELSACSTGIATAAAFFEAGAGVDPVTKNVRNTTGGATNVQFQLLDSKGAVIKAGDSSQVASTARTAVASGTAVLPYAVQYVATGATTAGTVIGSVTYSINYQ